MWNGAGLGLCADRVPISGLHHNRVVFAIICLIEAERRAILQPCTVRQAYVCYGGRRDTRIFHRSQSLCSQIVWDNEVRGVCSGVCQKRSKKSLQSPVVLTGGLRTLSTGQSLIISYLGPAPALPEAATL